MIDPAEHWALWRRDPRATPFQSPAWLGAWWKHLGGGERIDLAARKADGALVGLLPAFVWVDEGTRKLVPVGAGHSDYLDALIDPAHDGRALTGLAAALDAERARFDEVFLPDLRADSPLLRLSRSWAVRDEPGEVCPVARFDAGAPLLAQLSKTRRRKVVHDRHRAEALGGVSVALAAPDEVDGALHALFALHATRWATVGAVGVLADPKVQAFHRAAAPALAGAGLLRLVLVRREGRIVAVLLGFADGRRGYSYINGVDHSAPKQSFGTLAFEALIEDALRGGATEFHFLRGEEPYKYGWGAEPTRTVRRVMRSA